MGEDKAADLHQLGEGSSNGGQVHPAVEVLYAQTLQAFQAGNGAKCSAADVEPVATPEDGEGFQAVEEQATQDAK